jgi:hypothetical protein
MHTANARRIAWFMQLKRILQFQKQQFAPRHAALRLQRPTKNDFSVRSSGYGAFAKLGAFAVGHNGILALGYRPSALVNGPIDSSGILAAHIKVLATKPDVFGYYKIRNGSLASPRSKGLGPEHQLLQRRYQPRPVHGVQLPKPVGNEADRFLNQTFKVKPPNPLTLAFSTNEMANGFTATPRRFPVSSITSLPAVGDAWASRLPSARSSFVDVGDEASLRARPPPKEEQFYLDGLANRASPIGRQVEQKGDSGYQPQQRKASSSATTIHIDGSVLGRWAIQHLERTLGKPATGMTGVDPRANPPRSRVSPF